MIVKRLAEFLIILSTLTCVSHTKPSETSEPDESSEYEVNSETPWVPLSNILVRPIPTEPHPFFNLVVCANCNLSLCWRCVSPSLIRRGAPCPRCGKEWSTVIFASCEAFFDAVGGTLELWEFLKLQGIATLFDSPYLFFECPGCAGQACAMVNITEGADEVTKSSIDEDGRKEACSTDPTDILTDAEHSEHNRRCRVIICLECAATFCAKCTPMKFQRDRATCPGCSAETLLMGFASCAEFYYKADATCEGFREGKTLALWEFFDLQKVEARHRHSHLSFKCPECGIWSNISYGPPKELTEIIREKEREEEEERCTTEKEKEKQRELERIRQEQEEEDRQEQERIQRERGEKQRELERIRHQQEEARKRERIRRNQEEQERRIQEKVRQEQKEQERREQERIKQEQEEEWQRECERLERIRREQEHEQERIRQEQEAALPLEEQQKHQDAQRLEEERMLKKARRLKRKARQLDEEAEGLQGEVVTRWNKEPLEPETERLQERMHGRQEEEWILQALIRRLDEEAQEQEEEARRVEEEARRLDKKSKELWIARIEELREEAEKLEKEKNYWNRHSTAIENAWKLKRQAWTLEAAMEGGWVDKAQGLRENEQMLAKVRQLKEEQEEPYEEACKLEKEAWVIRNPDRATREDSYRRRSGWSLEELEREARFLRNKIDGLHNEAMKINKRALEMEREAEKLWVATEREGWTYKAQELRRKAAGLRKRAQELREEKLRLQEIQRLQEEAEKLRKEAEKLREEASVLERATGRHPADLYAEDLEAQRPTRNLLSILRRLFPWCRCRPRLDSLARGTVGERDSTRSRVVDPPGSEESVEGEPTSRAIFSRP